MPTKPTLHLAVVGGDTAQQRFTTRCQELLGAAIVLVNMVRRIELESEARVYHLHSCGLACGSLNEVPYLDDSHALAMLWLVSREQSRAGFMGHPDLWLLSLAKQLGLQLVVFWMEPPVEEALADVEEVKLRELIAAAGVGSDDVALIREKKDDGQLESLQRLFACIDALPVPPPKRKKGKKIFTCRAIVFLQESEAEQLQREQRIQIITAGGTKQWATFHCEQMISGGQCGLVTLTFESNAPKRPGRHFYFELSPRRLDGLHHFGYLLIDG